MKGKINSAKGELKNDIFIEWHHKEVIHVYASGCSVTLIYVYCPGVKTKPNSELLWKQDFQYLPSKCLSVRSCMFILTSNDCKA